MPTGLLFCGISTGLQSNSRVCMTFLPAMCLGPKDRPVHFGDDPDSESGLLSGPLRSFFAKTLISNRAYSISLIG